MVSSEWSKEDKRHRNSHSRELQSSEGQGVAGSSGRLVEQQESVSSATTVVVGSKASKRRANEQLTTSRTFPTVTDSNCGRCPERCHAIGNRGVNRSNEGGYGDASRSSETGSQVPAPTLLLSASSTSVPSTEATRFCGLGFVAPGEPGESGVVTGVSGHGESERNRVERCQSSAFGRAGSTGSIDVGSRSGLTSYTASSTLRSPSTSSDGILTGRGDSDVATQNMERQDSVFQWLQALGLQATGACRADERLRPLLRLNVSCVGPDGRLRVHLGQHFKARELALLARCLCAPLVSVRVGKVARQGRRLQPTALRGFLTLTLQPGSEMRVSFVGDDEVVERIAVTTVGCESPQLSLQDILADVSGRTFVLKLAGGKSVFFWQSEKLKSVGDELILKMKDLLRRQPTLSQLTGIDEARLDTFGHYFCAALAASPQTSVSQPPGSSLQPGSWNSSTGTHSEAFTSLSTPSASDPSQRQMPPLSTASYMIRDSVASTDVLTPGSSIYGSLSSSGSSSSQAKSKKYSGPSCSRVVNSFHPSTTFIGLNRSCVSRTNEESKVLVSSWSTPVSPSNSGAEKSQSSSLSAGLYTSYQIDPCRTGQDSFSRLSTGMMGPSVEAFPISSPSQNLAPSTLFLGKSIAPGHSFLPPVSTHIPISTSLLPPYYCPCPLGPPALQYTFAPPYLPSSESEGGLLSPSAPFFSVRPPPSLLPQGTLSFREFSLSQLQFPGSSLVTAALPIPPSSMPPFFVQPATSIPILHVPSQSYLLRAPSAFHGAGFPGVSAERRDNAGSPVWRVPSSSEMSRSASDLRASSNATQVSANSPSDLLKQIESRHIANLPSCALLERYRLGHSKETNDSLSDVVCEESTREQILNDISIANGRNSPHSPVPKMHACKAGVARQTSIHTPAIQSCGSTDPSLSSPRSWPSRGQSMGDVNPVVENESVENLAHTSGEGSAIEKPKCSYETL